MARRVRLTLGHRQAAALLAAGLIGVEDMLALGDHDEAALAEAALDVLAGAMREAGEA